MASEAPQAPRAAPAAGSARTRRTLLAVLVLLALSVVCSPFFADRLDRSAPQAERGVLDLSGHGPLTQPVELRGVWRMDWLTAPAPGASVWMPVPSRWAGRSVQGHVLDDRGAATYRLTLRGLEAGRYSLFLPKTYGGYRIWANGRLMATLGTFGLTPETSRYAARAQTVPIDVAGGDLDLRIDMSTYHHSDNGLMDTPVFGLTQGLNVWMLMEMVRSLLLLTSLLLLSCLGAVIFVFRPEDRTALYLALGAALLLPLAAMLSHDNLLAVALPHLSFAGQMVLQYLCSAAALAAGLAYAHELFPQDSPRLPYLAFQALNGVRFLIYAGIGVTGDMLMLSHYSSLAVIFRTVAFVWILGLVVLAALRRREGSALFLFGMGALFLSIIYTDLVNNAHLPPVFGITLLPVGMLLMLYSQLVLMAERWIAAIRIEARANDDLRRLLDVNISITSEMQLEALLAKVVEVTSRVIHADRSSLFLFDPKRRQLWSAVAEGLEQRQIRFPSGEGLAGWVFTHGEAVNLADAYQDPRFNREVDASTGYRTTSILTVPVTARDGRRLGVMQALNRLDADRFDQADLERMSAFAAQAAVAIDNATLFADVAAERNYNESILRSLAAGVVTLDREIRTAKLNPAAARILEAPVTRLEGVDVRAWIAASNPDLLNEIDTVARSGKPRSLLDADIRTARGQTISANLSIVPLIGERGSLGLLILIEDISGGKRMESAMRRFMSQKVVDQVLEHEGDDVLFGAAVRASVLFADIRNFTSLAETLQPRETVDMLNEIFSELVEAVNAHDGTLDKFLGDAVMAVYGAPLPGERDPQNAVQSAIQMIEMLEDLNKRRRRRGREPLRLGVGIATGDMVAGTIGSLKRMDYTVIGDSVNLASRLQQLTKYYQSQILICEQTAAALDGSVAVRELDTLRVRGRRRPVGLFEVLAGDPASRTPALEAYARGRAALAGRRWGDAVEAFEAAVAADPDDRPSALMLDRARELAARPPADDWDGVWGETDAA